MPVERRMTKPAMQLRRKFLLAFVLVALTIAGVLVVTFDSQRDAAVASASEDAAEQAELAASTIDRQLVEKRQSIAIAADHPELVDPDRVTRRQRVATIREQTDFEGVSVVAANGTMTALANEDGTGGDAVGGDFSDRAYVQAALNGRVYVSDPFTARTGNRIVVVSAPIRSDGEIVGTLNGAFYLSGSALFAPIERQSNYDTQIRVTEDGEALYADEEAIDSPVDGRAIVHTTGWTVTVDRRRSTVTAQIRRLAVAQAVAGIVMLGAVALFGLWIYRSDIRQAERLRDQFRRIENREYDHRVDLSGSTEWSEIGASANRLTETLARREQMLLVLNRLLRHNLRNSLNVIVGRADLIAGGDGDRDEDHADEIRSTAGELLHLSGRARKTEALITDDHAGFGTPVDVASVVAKRVAAFRKNNPDATVEVDASDSAYATVGSEFTTVVDELLANTVDHAGPAPNVRVTVARVDGCLGDATAERSNTIRWNWSGGNAASADAAGSRIAASESWFSQDRDDADGRDSQRLGAASPRRDDEVVEIRVSDDGPGVPPEERAVLSGEREIDPLHHTAGLGLWLTDWIISQAGGTVDIDCDDGTTVIVRLPVASAPEDGE